MKIAILGAGKIGGTLGVKWVQSGHNVVFGVRELHSQKVQGLLRSSGGKAVAGLITEAVPEGDIILFSTPWDAVSTIAQDNAISLVGKILIDATNNFGARVINNLENLQNAAPTAKIFRAFNSLGWEMFANPTINEQRVDMFYSGPDGEARSIVENLITDIDVHPIWIGDNDNIHLVDNMGALWVTLAFRQGWGRDIAFKLLSQHQK
jgi:predicted dinucleotide-binding enzyme